MTSISPPPVVLTLLAGLALACAGSVQAARCAAPSALPVAKRVASADRVYVGRLAVLESAVADRNAVRPPRIATLLVEQRIKGGTLKWERVLIDDGPQLGQQLLVFGRSLDAAARDRLVRELGDPGKVPELDGTDDCVGRMSVLLDGGTDSRWFLEQLKTLPPTAR